MRIKKLLGVAVLFVMILSGCNLNSNAPMENRDFSEYKPMPANGPIELVGGCSITPE
ncbi:hypothetical protein [Lederbergia ruris]|uniref:hypothetical protein n=1 Tax=Lederbergia ruris TaxID=217495 RepID=UPI0039A33515